MACKEHYILDIEHRNMAIEIIETLFSKVSGKNEIWYATNGEICDYHNAYKKLVFSADGSRIYNPSATELWAEIDGKTIALPAGKVTCLS